jgi:hypothetical protein
MSAIEQDAPSAVTSIHFFEGALSVQTQGSVAPNEPWFYALRGERGQKMIVNLIPLAMDLFLNGTITLPDGQQTGEPGGVVMSQVLSQSGTYTIRVEQSDLHLSRGGRFVLEVIILPAWLQIRS